MSGSGSACRGHETCNGAVGAYHENLTAGARSLSGAPARPKVGRHEFHPR